jgi:tRNA(Ile)-lysidine synthase
LIDIRRKELINWLRDRGESWREDASNLDVGFTRNRIRHELMPNLLTYNPRVVETLAGMADIARNEEEFWDDYISKLVPEFVRRQGAAAHLDIVKLKSTNVAVVRRILRWAISIVFSEAQGSLPSALGVGHVNRLLRFALEGQSGTYLQLPEGLKATKDFTNLVIERIASETATRLEKPHPVSDNAIAEYSYRVAVPTEIEVPETGRRFSFEIVPAPDSGAGYNKKESVLISLDAGLSLILRSWHPGDCLRPKGHRTPKKLKEFFQRKRISLSERGRWPVVTAGNRIVWTRGLGVAEEFLPVDQSIQAILLTDTEI